MKAYAIQIRGSDAVRTELRLAASASAAERLVDLGDGEYAEVRLASAAESAQAHLKCKTKVTGEILADFYTQLYQYLEVNDSLIKALNALLPVIGHNAGLGDATIRCLERFTREGAESALSEYEGTLPRGDVQAIINAVKSGKASVVVKQLAESAARGARHGKDVMKAITMPLINVIAAVGVAIYVVVTIIPKFASMFAAMGAKIPPVTQVLLNVADLVKRFPYAFVLLLPIIYLPIRNRRAILASSAVQDLMDRLPVVRRFVAKSALSKCLRSLCIMTGAGVPPLQALEQVERVTHHKRTVQFFRSMHSELVRGAPTLYDAANLSRKHLGHEGNDLIRVYKLAAETGQADVALERLAVRYERDTEAALNATKPFLLIGGTFVAGAIATFVVFATYSPIFDAYSAALKH